MGNGNLANQWLKDDDQTDSNLDNESGSEQIVSYQKNG